MPTGSSEHVKMAVRAAITSLNAGRKLLFLCGAGISTDAPACAPAWLAFRDSLIKSLIHRLKDSHYISNETARTIHSSLLHIEQHSRSVVKPELVLHWLHAGLHSALLNSFRVLSTGTPNFNHRAIAALAKHGVIDSLATTNFDLYLEQALDKYAVAHQTFGCVVAHGSILPWSAFEPSNSESALSIFKIHGSLEAPTTIQATLRQVSRSLPPPLRAILSSLLHERHVLVLGYSGNDYDLFPFLVREHRRMFSLTWCEPKRARLNPDAQRLLPNMRLVVSDAKGFLLELCSQLSIRVDTNHECARSKIATYEADLEFWASDIDPLHAAHALAMLARHLGHTSAAMEMSHVVQVCAKAYIARSLNMLGVLARRPNVSRALRLYKMALATARPLRKSDPLLFSNILGNIGALHHDDGKHLVALKWLRRSVFWAKRGKSVRHVFQNVDDIGNCLRAIGRISDAIKSHSMAIRYHRRIGNLLGVAHALHNRGEALRRSGHIREAWSDFVKSLDLKEKETAEAESIIRSLLNVFEMSLELGRGDTLDIGKRLLRLLTSVADPVVEARVNLGIAQLYAKAGNRKLGIIAFEKAQRLIRRIRSWEHDKEKCALVERAKAALDL